MPSPFFNSVAAGSKADGKVMLQPVEVGPVVGGNWLIREGLEGGEKVVVEGFQKITAGIQVKTVPWKTEAATDEGKPIDTDSHDTDVTESGGKDAAATGSTAQPVAQYAD